MIMNPPNSVDRAREAGRDEATKLYQDVIGDLEVRLAEAQRLLRTERIERKRAQVAWAVTVAVALLYPAWVAFGEAAGVK